MIRWTLLNPNERLLVESPINHYKVAGPGQVFLVPLQKALTKLYVGPMGHSFQYSEVRTAEDISLNVTAQIIYRVAPELFPASLLPRVPGLNEGGWQKILHWQTEYVLRMLIAQCPWRELSREQAQKRLERQLAQTLADRLKIVGLDVIALCLVKMELPTNLQKSLIQAEQDNVEAQGRATVLKNYLEIFGDKLSQAMPYIIQWEMMNTVHKNGDPKILVTNESLSPKIPVPTHGTAPSAFQLQWPVQ